MLGFTPLSSLYQSIIDAESKDIELYITCESTFSVYILADDVSGGYAPSIERSHMNEIQYLDYGWNLVVCVKDQDGCPKDVSSANSIDFLFAKPNNEFETKVGNMTTDGIDGSVYYYVEQGFFDETGTWQLQVVVDYGESKFHSNIVKIKVKRNLS